MSYESKIYAVKKYSFKLSDSDLFCSRIEGMIELGSTGWCDYFYNTTRKLFDTETDYTVYLPDGVSAEGDEIMVDTTEDKYGHRLKYASNVPALYASVASAIYEDDNTNFKKLLKFIEMYEDDPEITFVHYGH